MSSPGVGPGDDDLNRVQGEQRVAVLLGHHDGSLVCPPVAPVEAEGHAHHHAEEVGDDDDVAHCVERRA